MNHLYSKLFSAFAIISLWSLIACKGKENIEPQNEIWQRHTGYDFYASTILKSTSFDNVLFSSGLYFISKMHTNDKGVVTVEHYLNTGSLKAPAVFSPLLIATSRDRSGTTTPAGDLIYFSPADEKMNSTLTLLLDLEKAAPGIKRVGDSNPEWGAFSIPEGNRVRFLTSYTGTDETVGLVLIELEYNSTMAEGPSPVRLISIKPIPLSLRSQYIRSIRFINDYFYVIRDNTDSQANQIMRVSTNGTVIDIGSLLNVSTLSEGFFPYGNDKIGFYTTDNEVLLSSNQGISWQRFGEVPLWLYNFNIVKDRILTQPSMSQLVDLDLTTLKFTEISNNGLPSIPIQSINYLQDTVYVSTLGGGMYKKSYQSVLNEIQSKQQQ